MRVHVTPSSAFWRLKMLFNRSVFYVLKRFYTNRSIYYSAADASASAAADDILPHVIQGNNDIGLCCFIV